MSKFTKQLPLKLTDDKQLVDLMQGSIIHVGRANVSGEPVLSIEFDDERAYTNVQLRYVKLAKSGGPISDGYSHIGSFISYDNDLWHAYLEDREVHTIVRDSDKAIAKDSWDLHYKIEIAMTHRNKVILENVASARGVTFVLSAYMPVKKEDEQEFFKRLHRSGGRQEFITEDASGVTLYITVEDIRP